MTPRVLCGACFLCVSAHKKTALLSQSGVSSNLSDDLFESRCLADAVAQIVQLRSSDLTVTNDVDMVDLGRMKGERSFNAYSERKTSYGKRFSYAAVLERDDDAFERLQSFSVAFNDLDPHLNGVADAEFGQIGLHCLFFNNVYDIHLTLPP